MGEKSGSGSGMNNPGHILPRAEKQFFGLKYLNSSMRIRDPEWKKIGSGINIRITAGTVSDVKGDHGNMVANTKSADVGTVPLRWVGSGYVRYTVGE
jgi:hypothetical protein